MKTMPDNQLIPFVSLALFSENGERQTLTWDCISPDDHLDSPFGEIQVTFPLNLNGDWCATFIPSCLVRASLSFGIRLEGVGRETFILVPGAVVDGNRFRVQPSGYAPMFDAACPDETTPVIGRIPRLDAAGNDSSIQLLAGGSSLPTLFAFSPYLNQMVQVSTSAYLPHPSDFWAETGLTITQSKTTIDLSLDFPAKRSHRYRMLDDLALSPDQPASLKPNDRLTIKGMINGNTCQSIQDLMKFVKDGRNPLHPPGEIKPQYPLEAAAKLIAENLDLTRWSEEGGCYFDHMDGSTQTIQPGWTGGGMNTLYLLTEGSDTQRQRAWRTIDTLINLAQTQSGLMAGYLRNGQQGGDGFDAKHASDWHLLRKSGDFALFLLRHCKELESQNEKVPQRWQEALQNLLTSFKEIHGTHGRFGQFVDVNTKEIVVGGESAAGSVVAALAEGGAWLGDDEAIEIAKVAGKRIATEAIAAGGTFGGPGEILKAPDSESSFGLLEGLVSLWEVTRDDTYLNLAEAIAHQAITWVVPYDYKFPPKSTFGTMEMQTTGTVIASAQNKHSSPGICTFSSLALLKVARATEDQTLLAISRDIAKTLPQYVSRSDRPIRACNGENLPNGWICERVNMSDWELGGIGQGEVFYGTCWCETSVLLSALELPGILLNQRDQTITIFDHVEVKGVDWHDHSATVEIYNPCNVPAKVKVVLDPDPVRP
ncbi:MAG: hypothetical protein MUC92_12270, partial [Fimbriimonadaceae bacterium]|nr:hypothetical protein [Fimbriimonadaceae bacterium]